MCSMERKRLRGDMIDVRKFKKGINGIENLKLPPPPEVEMSKTRVLALR